VLEPVAEAHARPPPTACPRSRLNGTLDSEWTGQSSAASALAKLVAADAARSVFYTRDCRPRTGGWRLRHRLWRLVRVGEKRNPKSRAPAMLPAIRSRVTRSYSPVRAVRVDWRRRAVAPAGGRWRPHAPRTQDRFGRGGMPTHPPGVDSSCHDKRPALVPTAGRPPWARALVARPAPGDLGCAAGERRSRAGGAPRPPSRGEHLRGLQDPAGLTRPSRLPPTHDPSGRATAPRDAADGLPLSLGAPCATLLSWRRRRARPIHAAFVTPVVPLPLPSCRPGGRPTLTLSTGLPLDGRVDGRPTPAETGHASR